MVGAGDGVDRAPGMNSHASLLLYHMSMSLPTLPTLTPPYTPIHTIQVDVPHNYCHPSPIQALQAMQRLAAFICSHRAVGIPHTNFSLSVIQV